MKTSRTKADIEKKRFNIKDYSEMYYIWYPAILLVGIFCSIFGNKIYYIPMSLFVICYGELIR